MQEALLLAATVVPTIALLQILRLSSALQSIFSQMSYRGVAEMSCREITKMSCRYVIMMSERCHRDVIQRCHPEMPYKCHTEMPYRCHTEMPYRCHIEMPYSCHGDRFRRVYSTDLFFQKSIQASLVILQEISWLLEDQLGILELGICCFWLSM